MLSFKKPLIKYYHCVINIDKTIKRLTFTNISLFLSVLHKELISDSKDINAIYTIHDLRFDIAMMLLYNHN